MQVSTTLFTGGLLPTWKGMQECGRAGRNGQASSAVIYVNKSDLSKRTTIKEMKILCPATDVQALYSVFLL